MSLQRTRAIPRAVPWLLLAASPSRLLLVLLLLVNPSYLDTFLDPQTRQFGLPVLIAALTLAAASYPVMLGALWLHRSGRRGLSIALAVFAFIAMELPACLLLLLTPAALVLMECLTQGECPPALPVHPLVSLLRYAA